MEKESQIKEYVQNKEKGWLLWTFDSIKSEFNSLVWRETKETEKWLHLFEWLKNDKNLLTYAELKNKEESELSSWEKIKLNLLELKLSITCPYFSDFKAFLEELKKWEYVPETVDNTVPQNTTSTQTDNQWWQDELSNESETTETIEETHEFCNVPLWEIKSYPYYKNSKTWVTWCSATAQMNWQNFGLSLPHGDAYNAWAKPWKESLFTLPKDKKEKKPSKNWPTIKSSEFQSVSDDANFADIYVESKSNYGHRAVAFRDSTWQRYVLDPYIRVRWRLDDSPKKLEDYLSTKKIVKSHFYQSNWYSDKELSYRG